jgi:predicted O-linked N-acetylglucosamine transferase (SPINDLY family)
MTEQWLSAAEQYLRAGRAAEAETFCRRILAQQPNHPLATHYLGVAACQLGRIDEGLMLMRRASEELSPDDPTLAYATGTMAGQLGRIDEALASLERAVRLNPRYAEAYNNLGQVLCLARRLPAAIECFRKATAIAPDHLTAANNVVYYSHFDASCDGIAVRREAERWAARFAERLTTAAKGQAVAARPPDRLRLRGNRLRVGYVSPDLYEHPVGRFMHTLLAHRDRDAFEVVAYSDRHPPDAMTAALRSLCDHWRDTANLDDAALAEQVRRDGIDILVDLSLHMGGNRLLTFARRPAAVQMTYLGYAGTSGMSAMDFRLSDPHLDPPTNERFYTERTLRLPRSYWCYASPPSCRNELGEVRPRPADAPMTFASLNNVLKVSDAAVQAWATILRRVPASRMIIHAQPGDYLRDTIAIFQRQDVDPRRLEFVAMVNLLDYFRTYERVDIALDSFPYAGGTTTCDAMWMGVPVVTLAGEIAVHRGGASLLRNVGLDDLIAKTVDAYIGIAVSLASSRQKLAELRATLRTRMEGSIVMNPLQFTREFESVLQQAWRQRVVA